MYNGQELMNFGTLVASAQHCKCSYCVAKEDVCYNPEYCHMVKLIKEIKGKDWWDNMYQRFLELGRFDILHPMINGKIIDCKVVPINE